MNPAGVRIVISALDKTKGAFGSATRGMTALAGSVFSLKTGLAAVAGAAGFGYMVKSSLEATDALAKTASKIGTTTEALGALRYAANLSGVETTTLDMAMQRFTRRLSEAVKGTGEAKGALQELGINAREISQLPLDQRMAVLADAFGSVSNETDKLRLAFKLFDSEGVALVNMLNNGSDGLKAMFDDAESLGLIMRSNAAKGVEQASDSLYRMGRVAIGVRDSFVAGIAPAIKLVSDRIVILAKDAVDSQGGFQAFAQTLAVSFINFSRSVVISIVNLKAEMSGLLTTVKEFKEFFRDDPNSGWFDNLFGKNNMKLRRLPNDIKLGQQALFELRKEIDDLNSESGGDKNAREARIAELSAEYNRIAEKVRGFRDELALLQNPMGKASESTSELQTQIDSLNRLFDELEESAKRGFGAVAESADGKLPEALTVLDRIKGSFKDTVGDVVGEIPTLEQSVESLTRGAMNNFTQSFTDAITGAKKFSDAMKSMAKSVVDSLIKMLVQYYITKPLFDAITGFIDGGSTPTPSAAPAGKRAIGGSVQAGTPYMVGERGQELFVPNQSGTIIPNNKLQSGGAVTVNQVINVSTGVQQTVRAEIANLMPQISNAAKSAVAEARMRGGSYSKALVGA